MKANKKSLIGRTIVDVQFHPFVDGRGGTAHEPVLLLDNGRSVYFETEETEFSRYGTAIHILDKKKVKK